MSPLSALGTSEGAAAWPDTGDSIYFMRQSRIFDCKSLNFLPQHCILKVFVKANKISNMFYIKYFMKYTVLRTIYSFEKQFGKGVLYGLHNCA